MVKTVKQGFDVKVKDEMKMDQVVSELARYKLVVGITRDHMVWWNTA